MERIDREGISELPTDNINPVKVEDLDYSRIDLNKLYNILSPWINEAIDRTKNTGKEHGFRIDADMNVIGMLEGDEDSITWPSDYAFQSRHRFHTHPQYTRETGELDVEISEVDSVHDIELDGDTIYTPSFFPSSRDIEILVQRGDVMNDLVGIDMERLAGSRNKPTGYIISFVKNHKFSRGSWMCIVRYTLADVKTDTEPLKEAQNSIWANVYGLKDTEGINRKIAEYNTRDPLTNFESWARDNITEDEAFAIIEEYTDLLELRKENSGTDRSDVYIDYDFALGQLDL